MYKFKVYNKHNKYVYTYVTKCIYMSIKCPKVQNIQ